MLLETFGEEQIYNLLRIGSFGRFYSGDSFPIEYIMTTFSAAQLADLTFARDIRPEPIDFELLMQRDIDEERVQVEMEPYLNPHVKQLTAAEIKSRAVFFPPLLAAIVPTQGKTMSAYYSDEISQIACPTGGKEHFIREWPGLFKLTYFTSTNPHAYQIQLSTDNLTQIGVQCEPVQLEIRLAKGNQAGARLVIIDGQHRLLTLKKVYDKYPQLLENLGVPVCILFAPHATRQKNSAAAPLRIPTVPEVFRHLFVDVNNTAKPVGVHFNILLADNTLGSIICRQFCDEVLRRRGPEGLAVIEWNTQTKKDSTKIIRAYSLTSIGIINKALEESLGKRRNLLNYVLQLDEVEDKLYPTSSLETAADYYPPLIKWDQFSLAQKSVLAEQVKKYLLPCLELIFFTTDEFVTAMEIFMRELQQLKELAASEQPDTPEAKQVINQILDYMPIGEGKSFESSRLLYRHWELRIKQAKEKQVATMVQYALFQRALLEAWAQFVETVRNLTAEPQVATQGLVNLLNLALQQQGQFFNFEQPYMQHSVFLGTQIIVREETRKVLAQLLLVHLANPAYVQKIISGLGITKRESQRWKEKLQQKGQNALLAFPQAYKAARQRTFKANYRLYLSLSGEQREELAQAEAEQKRHQQAVKAGKRTKLNAVNRFELLIDNYVSQEVEVAVAALKNNLALIEAMPSIPTEVKEEAGKYWPSLENQLCINQLPV
jgi:hypothetical protein